MSPQKDPKYSKNLLNAFVIGFAVFSMVFGAGNLIFPPFIGLESGRKWLLGLIPFFLADVGIFLLCLKAFIRSMPVSVIAQRLCPV